MARPKKDAKKNKQLSNELLKSNLAKNETVKSKKQVEKNLVKSSASKKRSVLQNKFDIEWERGRKNIVEKKLKDSKDCNDKLMKDNLTLENENNSLMSIIDEQKILILQKEESINDLNSQNEELCSGLLPSDFDAIISF